MPIWLRNYTLKAILQNLQAESEHAEKQRDEENGVQRLESNKSRTLDIPDAVKKATYTTTVSKKQ